MAVACVKTSGQFFTSSSSSSGPSSSILSGSGSVGSGAMNGGAGAGGGHLQSQLTRSLERILEDANLSGELKLSGRKLKDFPKAAGKFNLSDTVIADLSRNRFCELPEDITSLAFLERLLVFHNTIRSIPDTIRGLHSLTYLDLRNNQLAVMPREICFLPLQVLLVSNNRLVTLPDELGRMEELTELDAACNQITHLPPRMGDLRNLRSLTLRNNQLVYLPRDLTCLQLVFLDISCNKIATLPVELRLMGSLVDLELSNNPLTSPPASLCVRGLVHVFKYLETAATKEEKSKCGLDGHATLRRSALTSKNSTGSLLDGTRNRRAHVDSGYSTSDGGFEGKRWSQDDPHDYGTSCSPKWSPIPMHTGFAGKPPPGTSSASSSSSAHQLPHSGGYSNLLSSTGGNGGLSGLLGSDYHGGAGTLEEEFRKGVALLDQQERKKLSNNNSNDISPEGDVTPDSMKADEKMRSLGNIQTYREYKEALRQQRSQSDIYRPKEQQAQTPDSGGSTGDSPLSNFSPYNKSQATTPSPSVYSSSNQSSPLSPHHSNIHKLNQINANSNHNNNNNNNNNGFNPAGPGSSPLMSPNRNIVAPFEEQQSNSSTSSTPNKRPVQKVIPSRNITSTYQQSSPSPTHLNGNHAGGGGGPPSSVSNGKIPIPNGTPVKTALSNSSCAEYAYVKPNSPCKASSGILTHNNVPSSIPKPTANGVAGLPPANGSQKPLTATVGYVNNAKPGQKTNKTVSWNRDVPTTDKLSFTMRREFDKQKEETELIQQLRQIIETRLKMTLPEDIAPALTDGVVLCHLANHVRPRSVGSIHVPSPAVPKLTMARCRRNVDNFLDACRRIGVDEELICSCQDIVPPSPPPAAAAVAATIPDVPTDVEQQPQTTEPEVDHVQPPNPPAMFRTVFALLHRAELMAHGPVHRPTSPPPPPPPSIIINNNINNNNHHQTGNKPSTLTAANTNNTTTAEAERRDRHPISSSCGGADGEEPNGNYHRASPNPLHSFANNHLLRNTSTPNNTTNSKCPKTLLEYHFDQEEEDQEEQALVAEREDVMRVQARLRAVSASESEVHRSCGGGGGGGDGRNVPATLDLSAGHVGGTGGGGRRKRKFPSTKFSGGDNRAQDRSGSGGLNEIVEECEYDSDIGKFRCRQGPDDYDDSESSMNSLDEETDAFTPTNANQGINDLNSAGTPTTAGGSEPRDVLLDFNINSEENDPAGTGRKIVSKRIEFWESNAGGSGEKIVNSPLRRSVSEEDNEWKEGKQWSRKSDHPTISTILCLGTFILTVVYLYLYPLPNY